MLIGFCIFLACIAFNIFAMLKEGKVWRRAAFIVTIVSVAALYYFLFVRLELTYYV